MTLTALPGRAWAAAGARRSAAALALGTLLLLALAPLFAGMNFVPFTRYPFASRGLLEASGQVPRWDESYLQRVDKLPWVQEQELASVALSWAQDRFTADQLRRGRLPLWDPYTGCGLPTLDEGQFRPFNLFRIPFFLFPSAWIYSLTLVVPLFLGAFGAYRWFRGTGFSEAASVAGSGVFVLNPWMLERLVTADAPSFLLLPWALLGLRQARPHEWGRLALAALPFVLMAHSGHPETALLAAGLAAAAFLFARGEGESAPTLGVRQRWLVVAEVAALSVAATAVLWVPLLKIGLNADSYRSAPFRNIYPYSWRALLAPASDCFLACGLGALLFATADRLWARCRFWLFVIAAAALVVFPLPGLGHGIAQGFSAAVGLPVYYLKYLLWAGLSFLVPVAWEEWSAAGLHRRLRAAAVGLALLLASLGTSWACPLPWAVQFSLPMVTALALLVQVSLLGTAAWRRGPRFPGVGTALLFLLPLAFPLSWNQLAWNRHEGLDSELARWLRQTAPHQRVVSLCAPYMVLPPNLGQVLRVPQAEAVAAFFPNRYLRLYHQGKTPPTLVVFDSPQLTAFRQLGATLMAVPQREAPAGVAPLFSSAGLQVFSVPGASGRLHFASAVLEADPGRPIGAQVMALGGGSDAVAVVERLGSPAPPAWPGSPAAPSVAFLLDETHRVDVRTSNGVPGLLVLKDTWYPGWEAFVDGSRAPILRVNGCFRGVPVPAGDHTVSFRYRPWAVYIAAALSSLATALLLGLAFRRRPGAGA